MADLPVIEPTQRAVFSIGIYTGRSPFRLKPTAATRNPVLTREDVTDLRADLVADPFMVRHDGRWHMFFEALSADTGRGQICLATSDDALRWHYQRVVLREDFHLSYPHVVSWEGDYFMIPEACESGFIRLYKAVAFPFEWTFVGNLAEGPYVDPTPFFHDGRWWLFAATGTKKQWRSADLHLFHAECLKGPWTRHPQNPIVRDNKRIARPAGPVRTVEGKPIRLAQDCDPIYGRSVSAFEVRKLTPDDYLEVPVGRKPVLKFSGTGWNTVGMHQLDAHQLATGEWIACVDGWTLEEQPAKED